MPSSRLQRYRLERQAEHLPVVRENQVGDLVALPTADAAEDTARDRASAQAEPSISGLNARTDRRQEIGVQERRLLLFEVHDAELDTSSDVEQPVVGEGTIEIDSADTDWRGLGTPGGIGFRAPENSRKSTSSSDGVLITRMPSPFLWVEGLLPRRTAVPSGGWPPIADRGRRRRFRSS